MVTFEGKWSRGRVPLGALPMSQPFALSAEDSRLLDRAEELAGGETPGGLMLNLIELTQLLEALIGHPRVALGRGQPLAVNATAWRVQVEATLETSGEIRLSLPPGSSPPTLIAGESLGVSRRLAGAGRFAEAVARPLPRADEAAALTRAAVPQPGTGRARSRERGRCELRH